MADYVPQLGYGQRSEAPINTVNQWMRTQPWYQSLIKSFGQDPANVHLSDGQKQAVVRAAQANGVVVDEGNNGQEIDDSGNFQAKGHALRNTLIVAGLAAAALGTAGLAGAFAPAAAGAGAAEGAGTAAGGGLLASTATVPTVGALAAGGTGLAGGTAAGLGTAASVAGAGGAWDAAGNFIGDSTVSGAAGAGKGILDYASDLAGPLSSIAAGRAQGATQEAGINQAQDRNAIGLYAAENNANANENNFDISRGNLALNTSTAANNFGINRGTLANQNANTDLAQRKFAIAAPGERAGNAVRGDILSRAQDVSFAGLPAGINPPTISGGLRPSMFSADTRALGSDITSQARVAQAKGDTFAPLPDLPTYQAPEGGLPNYKAGPAPPTLTGLPSGGATTALGNTSSILALAPTFANIWRQYQAK